MYGIGAASENDIKAAIIAGSTAVGTAIAPGVGSGAGAAIGAALVALIPIVIDLVSQTPDAEMTDTVIPNPVSAESDVTDQGGQPVQEGTTFNLSKALPLIALGAGALYFATRKR